MHGTGLRDGQVSDKPKLKQPTNQTSPQLPPSDR